MVGQDQRPLPQDRNVPVGYHLEAQPAGALWAPDDSKMYQCRHTAGRRNRCPKVATIKVDRGAAWWRYCALHAYDRWVENGVVMHWILVRDVSS